MTFCATNPSPCVFTRRKRKRKKTLPIISLAAKISRSSISLTCSSMLRKVENPVQTQMSVSVFNNTLSSEINGRNFGLKSSVRRRIFVQTDTGCVLGVELDRRDSVNTVKRKIQLALNVPTDESSLTFGDHVLKNDLSSIRNDSPVLLTRNSLQRSLSTPCLSPTGKDIQQRDWSGGPIEILAFPSRCSRTKQLVKDVVKGIKNDVDPKPVQSGLGGAYYFRNINCDYVAIVKPTDEEPFAPNNPKGFTGRALGQPGMKKSVRVGETGFREVAAYLLDYDHFAKVPPTVLVKITHSVFHLEDVKNSNKNVHKTKPKKISKIASFQQYIPHDYDASDHGTSSFPVSAVHRIGILDVRIFNTDRHGGNLLVRNLKSGIGNFGGEIELIPIDHGLCLPETLEDPYFEWIYWAQASIPFSEDELEYIAKLDPKKDAEMLRAELPMIREACLRVLVLSTIFLKEAAEFGLCLSDIGEMMTRDFKGANEKPSEFEVICMEAKEAIQDSEFYLEFDSGEEKEFQFDLEFEENCLIPTSPSSLSHYGGFKFGSSRNPLSKLKDTLFEDAIEEIEEEYASKLVSCKSEGFTEAGLNDLVSCSNKKKSGDKKFASGNRTAEEQITSSASFVVLADMGQAEWTAFLDVFQDCLRNAFHSRGCGMGPRTRLGSSCQF